MILLDALLCNYGRGKCLIDIGTEGNRQKILGRSSLPFGWSLESFDGSGKFVSFCNQEGKDLIGGH